MKDSSAETVETSPQEDRKRLENLRSPIDVDWLRDYFKRTLRWSDQTRAHKPFAVRVLEKDEEREVTPGHFLVATNSAQKLRQFTEIIQGVGGSVQPTFFVKDEWRSVAGEEARAWGKSFFPLTIAESKLHQIKKQLFESGKAGIASDVVVISSTGRILEKPKNLADLVKMIRSIKGKRIRVLVGVCVLVPLKDGVIAPGLSEGAEIALKIKDLTEAEVATYAQENIAGALNVAGGIDFSSVAGIDLIDKSFMLRVSPRQNTIYDVFNRENGRVRKPVVVDHGSIKLLADYFNGVPKRVVGVLMKQAQELQEQVEKV